MQHSHNVQCQTLSTWTWNQCCLYFVLQLSVNTDHIDHILNILDANLSLGSSSGIVLAVPISKEKAASGEDIEKAIQQALQEAR